MTAAPQKPEATRWWTMRWPDFDTLDRASSVVIVPFGSIEQHGPHLPLDQDIANALTLSEMASAASRRVVLVAPPVWWGMAPHHMGFAGTITLRLETICALVRDICTSISSHGFRHILLVNGHGGNAAALAATTVQLSGDLGLFVSSVSYWSLIPDVLADIGSSEIGGMGHAGEMETSLALYLRPDSVTEVSPSADIPTLAGAVGGIDFRRPGPVVTPLDLARDTREGVIGDPTQATAEKGEVIVSAIVSRLVEAIDSVAMAPVGRGARRS